MQKAYAMVQSWPGPGEVGSGPFLGCGPGDGHHLSWEELYWAPPIIYLAHRLIPDDSSSGLVVEAPALTLVGFGFGPNAVWKAAWD